MHFKVYSTYYFSRLSENEKKTYKQILAAWRNYTANFEVEEIDTKEAFSRVIDALRDDIPELFYVNFGAISYCCLPGKISVRTGFRYSSVEAERIKERIAAVISAFKKTNTESDKVKAIHDFLVRNVKYSENTELPDAHNICGAMLKKEAVCEGYARAFKLMCDDMGIPCIFVTGIAHSTEDEDGPHAWNIVNYKGVNYQIDVTWDSNIYHSGHDLPMYFCVSDTFMRKNHQWENGRYPSCSIAGSIEKDIVDVTDVRTFASVLKKTAAARKETFVLRFNERFESPAKITDLIRKAAENNVVRVSAVSVCYLPMLDCAVIKFAY